MILQLIDTESLKIQRNIIKMSTITTQNQNQQLYQPNQLNSYDDVPNIQIYHQTQKPKEDQFEAYQSLKNFDSSSDKQSSKRKTKEVWTQQEDDLLYESYAIYGSKWNKLSKIIHKNDNIIKNRFYGRIRKLLRIMNSISKEQIRPRKHITYSALIRPIEAKNLNEEPFEGYNTNRNFLKQAIISFSRADIKKITKQECETLIDQIHQFNYQTRSYNLRIDKKQISDKASKKDTESKIDCSSSDNSARNIIPHKLDDEQLISCSYFEQFFEQLAKKRDCWVLEDEEAFRIEL